MFIKLFTFGFRKLCKNVKNIKDPVLNETQKIKR